MPQPFHLQPGGACAARSNLQLQLVPLDACQKRNLCLPWAVVSTGQGLLKVNAHRALQLVPLAQQAPDGAARLAPAVLRRGR